VGVHGGERDERDGNVGRGKREKGREGKRKEVEQFPCFLYLRIVCA